MNYQTDIQLLRAYAESGSEPAFSELVRRHMDFVYSAALRMVRDSHLAQDVTHISILSADGRTCKRLDTQRNQELDVDAHDLPRGLYLLRVEAQDRQWLQKLMIR